MEQGYFERRHRDEQRRAEWQMVDAALRQRTNTLSARHDRLRYAVGYWMLNTGARLIGQSVTVTLPRKEHC